MGPHVVWLTQDIRDNPDEFGCAVEDGRKVLRRQQQQQEQQKKLVHLTSSRLAGIDADSHFMIAPHEFFCLEEWWLL
jgi:hypothetical protein